jgi:hypothetical protein
MHAVLTRLGVSDRHEADAEGCVLVSPDDNLGLALGENFPAKRLGPEPGQAGQPRDLDGWRPPGPLRLQLFAAATPSRATPIRGPAPGCAPRPLPVCLQQIDTRPPVMPAGPLRGYRSICHMLPGAEQPVRLDRAPRPAYGARGALTGASAGCLRTRQSPTVETNQRISFREYGSETACQR